MGWLMLMLYAKVVGFSAPFCNDKDALVTASLFRLSGP